MASRNPHKLPWEIDAIYANGDVAIKDCNDEFVAECVEPKEARFIIKTVNDAGRLRGLFRTPKEIGRGKR